MARAVQVRKFQLFQNERYSPLSKWSSKGLLVTDRSAITTFDGSEGLSSIDEASTALLSIGNYVYLDWFLEI